MWQNAALQGPHTTYFIRLITTLNFLTFRFSRGAAESAQETSGPRAPKLNKVLLLLSPFFSWSQETLPLLMDLKVRIIFHRTRLIACSFSGSRSASQPPV
jgi:hypothetical protein